MKGIEEEHDAALQEAQRKADADASKARTLQADLADMQGKHATLTEELESARSQSSQEVAELSRKLEKAESERTHMESLANAKESLADDFNQKFLAVQQDLARAEAEKVEQQAVCARMMPTEAHDVAGFSQGAGYCAAKIGAVSVTL